MGKSTEILNSAMITTVSSAVYGFIYGGDS
jgi:hypothetical protein